MDRSSLTSSAMVQPSLVTANRRLIEAMETPPETGIEPRLDRVAAVTWHYARETDRNPDPARLRQLHHQLARLESDASGRRRLLLADARMAIQRAATGLEAV